MMRKLGAEFLGTFTLIFCGCGAAVLGGLDLLGVALAFGISVIGMAYAVGHISGGHFNPAVTLAALINKRMDCKDAIPYVVAQVLGAIAAAAVLSVVASGKAGYDVSAAMLASTGFGEHSPQGYGQTAGFLIEALVTALFVIVILGSTSQKAPAGFAPIAIGLALTLFILVAGNVTNASLNPARSTGPALIAGGWALNQLWLFWVAPLLGALVGGYVYKWACCGCCCNSGAGESCSISK